ncbi:wall-associated receptor kinase-like 6 isoform X2 [Amaranthus tricolor]|uniref:wall-associated receptor kinase-like 6 isoform X2 n=1 Tax=Amaranthus tricolor TaxID=29722 RepID=UPI00258DC521|nr:wall-associated receptor kinase-like 6 isoform X2 [Amaranthus tricolor]
MLESNPWLATAISISKPGCLDHCGEVNIPYPFGVGTDCYYDKWYEIICNTSKPFLRRFNLEVLDINWPGRYPRTDPRWNYFGANDRKLLVNTLPKSFCRNHSSATDGVIMEPVHSINFHGSPYRFSSWLNVFMVEGCGESEVLQNRSGGIIAGCASVCSNQGVMMNMTDCYGVGCCQASLLSSPTHEYLQKQRGLEFYQISLDQAGQVSTMTNKTCDIYAALIASDSVKKLSGKLSKLEAFSTVLEWYAYSINYNMLNPSYKNVSCYESQSEYESLSDFNSDIKCFCGSTYEGNPYLPYGCQGVEECHRCKHGCSLNDTTQTFNYYCEMNPLLKRASIIGFSTGAGFILLVLGSYWLYIYVKRRREIKEKAKYFKRNGGLLLQQQMNSHEGVVEKTKIFTIDELEKATDQFNENRILGQGGQGTVYKGMLMDGRIVAIKRSKKVDESQLEQFINEVVILSQLNHRNVVNLLGCCLETEVPLLVYEFIPNGTLYQHIHSEIEDFHVSWKMRLQIAAESAIALAYLHSYSSAPIYHRDIKSSNILLDDKYRAKISDFGTSKAITIEQTHVTTIVLGTYGYLDPEYFQSNQFTEKSDVYSFGVVLVELITGKKPICPTKDGGWISLAVEFLSHMESSPLSDITDARIADEGKEEEFAAVANLARRCLEMKGKQRPTMKEISVLLDGIRSNHVPNLKELPPAKNKQAVTELFNTQNSPFSIETFFSDEGASGSIEVQPLMIDI